MGRIIAIDYGNKRTGLAWTDPLQIIASGIGSFPTHEIEGRLKEIVETEPVEAFVLGYPTKFDGSDSHVTGAVKGFQKKLKKWFPALPVHLWDERLTSKMAFQAMIDGGLKKKKRRDKHLINQVSATIILQEFLDSNNY